MIFQSYIDHTLIIHWRKSWQCPVLSDGARHLVTVYDRARLKNSHFRQVDDLACRPRYRRAFLGLVYVVYDVYDVWSILTFLKITNHEFIFSHFNHTHHTHHTLIQRSSSRWPRNRPNQRGCDKRWFFNHTLIIHLTLHWWKPWQCMSSAAAPAIWWPCMIVHDWKKVIFIKSTIWRVVHATDARFWN